MSKTIRCLDCQVNYDTIMPISLNIPRDQWLLIHPKDGGVLCANCMIQRASKLPHIINIAAKIAFAKDYN